MSASTEFQELLDKLAVIPRIVGIRTEDAGRVERNGGSNGELEQKIAEQLPTLRSVVRKLEKALA